MGHFSADITCLVSELYDVDDARTIGSFVTGSDVHLDALIDFDVRMPGPSFATIADPRLSGGTLNMPRQGVGRYAIADREVFRPLQYCVAYLSYSSEAEWFARAMVQASSAHVEALVKRIGRLQRLPLGTAIRHRLIRAVVDPVTIDQVTRYSAVYNASKHDFTQSKDTHLFSLQDAVRSYFICRQLGLRLYPLASLVTDVSVFDSPATQPALRADGQK